MRIGSSCSDCWNAWALPWNEPCSVAGAPSSWRARCTASVAAPSETPCARLNDRVAAGNCPWCWIERLRVRLVSTLTRLDSGTGLPVRGETRKTALNSSGPTCRSGGASMMTRYALS